MDNDYMEYVLMEIEIHLEDRYAEEQFIEETDYMEYDYMEIEIPLEYRHKEGSTL